MDKGTCAFAECDRAAHTAGWCHTHYAQTRSGNPMKPIRVRRSLVPGSPRPICSVKDCGRNERGESGYCAMHYQRVHKHGSPGPADTMRPPRVGSECIEPGCGHPVRWANLCRRHVEAARASGNPRFREAPIKDACGFDGCDRPREGRQQWCSGHMSQARRGMPPRPIQNRRARGSLAERDEQGRKQCARCGVWQAEDRFYSSASAPDGLTGYCKECALDGRRLHYYGLTQEQFAARLDAQGGRCAVCGTVLEFGRRAHMDHDHTCCPAERSCGKCIRGILCLGCNIGLGAFGDDPARLLAAAAYLQSVTAPQPSQ